MILPIFVASVLEHLDIFERNLEVRPMVRVLFLNLLAVFCLVGLPASAQENKAPDAFIVEMSDKVVATMEAKRATYDANPEPLQLELLGLLEPVVDFESFSKGVMGKYHKDASPAQLDAFMDVFKHSLARLYTAALVVSEIERMSVQETISKSPTSSSVVILVETRVADPYTLQYNMRLDDNGDWKVRNILLDGVNIGLTFRNQFKSAMDMEKNDMDKVIQRWPEIIEGSQ